MKIVDEGGEGQLSEFLQKTDYGKWLGWVRPDNRHSRPLVIMQDSAKMEGIYG